MAPHVFRVAARHACNFLVGHAANDKGKNLPLGGIETPDEARCQNFFVFQRDRPTSPGANSRPHRCAYRCSRAQPSRIECLPKE